jgi:hypothetical protein
VGVRGPHLVPLCHETYARSFPRLGIVRFRAPALVPVCPKTYAISFPREWIVRFAHLHSPPYQFSDSNTDDWDNRPYLWESLRLKVKRRKRIGPGAGVRGRFIWSPFSLRPMPDPFQE